MILTVSPSAFRKTSLRLRDLEDGTITPLDAPNLVIGRHSETDLPIDDPEISRRHCRIFLRNQSWFIEDLRSTNGVFVNDQRISKTSLKQGDVLKLGTRTWAIEIPCKSPKKDLLKSIVDAIPPS